VGAVPARLLRSGEYSIRETFDLIGRVAFVGSRTLGEHGSRCGFACLIIPASMVRLLKFMVRRGVRRRVRWAAETKVADVLK
jgi:hypothetical protein